ncbi:hypothetical protein LWC34_08600 [Kibdelosporangium philippinense]|uniref:AMIN-like domain-containing protein n=1 Tax=Kibdelosporangium philippinense TaxID=211113 RepID=A0ABS8Z7W6_9PSEU|nr:hypothetical protein [Kibdelosporangium philippinense]MCE7002890.1 hypothetical protein [Kibdelosporangium philippinense]
MSRTTFLLLITMLAAFLVPTSATAAPYCGITWGSLPKSAPTSVTGELVNIRSGRHDCYDRLVLDFRSRVDGFHVSYVDQMTEDPTGNPIPLRGGAKLSVAAFGPAYDANGQPTYTFANRRELLNFAGYQTFRQLAWAGSFEAVTTVGLGVRARLPFRVLTWDNKVVVDVAHIW